MTEPHIALLVMVVALAGGNIIAMTVQMVRGGILTRVSVSLIKLRNHDRALDLVEKSL